MTKQGSNGVNGLSGSVVAAGLVLAALVLGGPAAPAWADDPQAYVITFSFHEDRSDPETNLVWTFELVVEEADRDNCDVGWEIKSLYITSYDGNGDPEDGWEDTTVVVDSQDGLWWLTHDDPDDPTGEEFADTPALEGTAELDFGNDDDVHYEVDFKPRTPQQGDPPGAAADLMTVIVVHVPCFLDPECFLELLKYYDEYDDEPVPVGEVPEFPIG